MLEGACVGGGEENEGDDAHGFLGIVHAMTETHPRCAPYLELAKEKVNRVRANAPDSDDEDSHEQKTKERATDWGEKHRQNNLVQQTLHFVSDGIRHGPFDD